MSRQIYLVDDDDAFRFSLTFLLEGEGYSVSGFDSAERFLAECQPRPAACLLSDIRMPGMSGLQLQDELMRRRIALPLVFLTAHGDVPMAVEAMRKGARHFLEKPFSDQRILEVIDDALASSAAAADPVAERIAALTLRERQMLDRVVAGKLNKTIADELDISIKTVELHRARMMDKMQTKSLAELIRMTARHLT